jgi:hypothetical protein
MKTLVGAALHQRNDVITIVSLHVSERAQIRKIERPVAQRLHRRVVIGGDNQFHFRADYLGEIISQRGLFFDGNLRRAGIGNHSDLDGIGASERQRGGHRKRACGSQEKITAGSWHSGHSLYFLLYLSGMGRELQLDDLREL